MKLGDIKIGNWVVDNGKYAQITGITCDGNIETTVNEKSNIELVEPIPLTQEILKKNGWSHDTYDNESYDNEDAEMLSLWVGEDGRNAWWWHAGFELVIPINYVHQLQNALALCEIEKEIEL